MKNEEIIRQAAIEAGVITEEEADKYERMGIGLPFHTAQTWSREGYTVKTGEQPVLKVKLWRLVDTEDGEKGFRQIPASLYSVKQCFRNNQEQA